MTVGPLGLARPLACTLPVTCRFGKCRPRVDPPKSARSRAHGGSMSPVLKNGRHAATAGRAPAQMHVACRSFVGESVREMPPAGRRTASRRRAGANGARLGERGPLLPALRRLRRADGCTPAVRRGSSAPPGSPAGRSVAAGQKQVPRDGLPAGSAVKGVAGGACERVVRVCVRV